MTYDPSSDAAEYLPGFLSFPCGADRVAELYGFTSISFSRQSFQARWDALGWLSKRDGSKANWEQYWVAIDDEFDLEVFPGGDRIYGAALPLCMNGEYHRARFDSHFEEAHDLARRLGGPPVRGGTDRFGDDLCRYSIWRGAHGVLVLQQDSIDFQRGGQLAFWLMPLASNEDVPHSSIMEWTEQKLCERFQSVAR